MLMMKMITTVVQSGGRRRFALLFVLVVVVVVLAVVTAAAAVNGFYVLLELPYEITSPSSCRSKKNFVRFFGWREEFENLNIILKFFDRKERFVRKRFGV
jgi:hypothetical protein